MALRILPFGTMPAVLHWGSCYIKGMLYKGYTTVLECVVAGRVRRHLNGFTDFYLKAPESQGGNLALTVLWVPCSGRWRGGRLRTLNWSPRHKP